ncbi:TIGR02391 family protein [Qipengyuania sp. MTN3-11]|uniref:TIGR02391 family protein n=1 Tax=Qipengyuania sp. MTN3-11 TaxID=3056557 RepID=UPI0036F25B4F
MKLLDRIRGFQEHLIELGLSRTTLALPAPTILALPSPDGETLELDLLFDRLIEDDEIRNVSRDLFDSGHYNLAVAEAFKAVDHVVQSAIGEKELSGTSLMDQVFSPSAPKLAWTARSNRTEKDHQKGYHRLFSGAMLGIRNPTTHDFDWISEPEEALECVVFAQHLLRKVKRAKHPDQLSSGT